MIANNIMPHHRRPSVTRIGQTIDKLMGGHLLDNQIDFIDFLPFLTIIIASMLLAAGLFSDGSFPNLNLGTSLGLNNGNLILKGRNIDIERPKRSTQGYARDIPDNNNIRYNSSNFW